MKRIAFFQENLDVGGIQKSLVNLLMNFDYEDYQVDLYLSEKKIFWDVDFPEQLTIKYLPRIPRLYSFIPFDTAKKLCSLNFEGVEEYDVAIDFNSYQFSCALGAITVPAKRRVMFIHNNVAIKLENEWKYRVLWDNFKDKFKYYDEFVGVSEGVIEPFKQCSGVYDKNFSVIPNTIDTSEIYKKAAEPVDFQVDGSKLNFVAVGRLCHQKGYDLMLDYFAQVKKQRDDVHLYIIGDGDKRFSLEYMRDSLGLTDTVTFLGQKTNPFVYMEKMDCFISASRYEGQGMNILEARALGLPEYCPRCLEPYCEGVVGYDDIVSAILSAGKKRFPRNDLHDYNADIFRRIKALAEEQTEAPALYDRKKLNIIALHLGTGGVEKAIVSMANLFAERYDVQINSVYNMPGSPAFPLDGRVKIRYLLFERPNREEWKAAVRNFRIKQMIIESFKGLRVLIGKSQAVKRTIRGIDDGIIICTRHEDNLKLSKYGSRNVLKVAQIHHDHGTRGKYLRDFRSGYGNIDILALLLPQLKEEAERVMTGCNSHTKVVCVPNFLASFPENVDVGNREKTVLAVGRVTEVKRFDLLIKQFCHMHERIPGWTLRILGDGEDMPKLQEMVKALKAEEYIDLAGRKTGEEVEHEMRRAAVFAMSSRSEGFPFVLMEAQSCGMPIVSYDVRVGPGFLIHDGQDGFLVPEGRQAEYEDRLCELCESSALRERMAALALTEIREFSRENVSSIWFSVLEGENNEK